MGVCKDREPEIVKILEDMSKYLLVDAAGFAKVNSDRSIGYCALYNVVSHLEKLTVSAGIDVIGMVVTTQKPVVIDDYPAFPKAVSAWIQIGMRSVVSVPVFIDGELIGAVTALSISERRHFSQSDIETIEGYADKIALLMSTAKIIGKQS